MVKVAEDGISYDMICPAYQLRCDGNAQHDNKPEADTVIHSKTPPQATFCASSHFMQLVTSRSEIPPPLQEVGESHSQGKDTSATDADTLSATGVR